jgi:dsDNA-specific endonuclease/ATPase MutS2
MKKSAWKPLVMLIGLGVVLIVGCGEKEAPSVKQSRAIAAENLRLEKDLERTKAQLKNLKEEYDKEHEKQRKQLEKYKKERDQWRVKSQRNVREQAKSLVDPLMEEITRLRDANRKLTAQLEESQK